MEAPDNQGCGHPGRPEWSGEDHGGRALLPKELGIREFVNADEIARGLSPFNESGVAVAAGRVMLKRMHDLVASGESFAFETTCAGQAYVPLLRQCRADGWRVTLLYLWLPSPQIALDRVARRVKQGGHSVPADVIVRRYWKGLANMRLLYLPLVDVALIYDNGDAGRTLVAEQRSNSGFMIHDTERWTTIEKATS